MATDEQKRWERMHRNSVLARVVWSSASNDYVASAGRTETGGGVDRDPVRTGIKDEGEARTTADRLAHRDCDGSCPPWSAV